MLEKRHIGASSIRKTSIKKGGKKKNTTNTTNTKSNGKKKNDNKSVKSNINVNRKINVNNNRNLKKVEKDFIEVDIFNSPKAFDEMADLASNFKGQLAKMLEKEAKSEEMGRSTGKQWYPTKSAYLNSFGPIENFSRQFSEEQKRRINAIIFNRSNADGYMSALMAWQYLTEGGKKKDLDVFVMGISPQFEKSGISKKIPWDHLKGRHVYITDISYNLDTINHLANEVASSVIYIDDHADGLKSLKGFPFIAPYDQNLPHSSCALASKFFFPNDVPSAHVQYIENNDAKLARKGIRFGNYYSMAFAVRYDDNTWYSESFSNRMYDGMLEMMNGDLNTHTPAYYIFIGNYMNEIRENMKRAARGNARVRNFLGYRAAVLNFDQPGLTKVISRELASKMYDPSGHMVMDYKDKSPYVDGAQSVEVGICFAYHMNRRMWNFDIHTDAHRSKTDMFELYNKIKQTPGFKDGQPKQFNIHFYFDGNPADLFIGGGNKFC